MINKKLSFVIPVTLLEKSFQTKNWRHDTDNGAIVRLNLILKSFIKMFNQEDLEIFIIICPTRDINKVSNIVKLLTSDKRFVILPEEAILKSNLKYIQKYNVDGWIIQQLLKLAISEYIKTDFFITLDSDIICIKPSSYKDFIHENKSIIRIETIQDYNTLYTDQFSKQEMLIKERRYIVSSKLLEYTRKQPYCNKYYSETPVVLHTKSVQNLLLYLNQKFNNNWMMGLIQNTGWTEQSLYFGFLEKSNQIEQFHIPSNYNSILDLKKSIWHYNKKYRTHREYTEDHFKNFYGYFIAIQSWLNIEGWLPSEYKNINDFYLQLEIWLKDNIS